MIPFGSTNKQMTGGRARELTFDWATRAVILTSVLALAVVTVIWFTLPQAQPQRALSLTRTGNSFSPALNQKQLADAVKAAEAAFRVYLKRDKVIGDAEAIAHEFAQAKSEADLMQYLMMLGSVAGDDYFAILTNQQYEHLTALISGGKVGADFDISWDNVRNAWTVSKLGPSAEAAGLLKDDVVYSVNGDLAEPSEDNAVRAATEGMLKARLSGLINTPINLLVRRDGKLVPVYLRTQVVSRVDAFVVDDMEHPLDKVKVPDFKTITFRHLYSDTLLVDLQHELTAWQSAGVKGIAIDLRTVSSGDAERAIRIAAMLREHGVLSRMIETTQDGHLVMKTWEIVNGAVHLKTKGPFTVSYEGKVDLNAKVPETDVVKDWPTNVYRGPVVALSGRQTAGAGELIASAMSESWRVEKRCMTVAKFYTYGKGTSQTFFPVGNGHWLRLSTGFYLQPDGSSIEGELGPGPNVACPGGRTDEWWFTRFTLVERFNVVPLPEWPGASK